MTVVIGQHEPTNASVEWVIGHYLTPDTVLRDGGQK